MFSFIVSTIDNSNTLDLCINSINKIASIDDEIVIVHQGTKKEIIFNKFNKIEKITHLDQYGLSQARNAGALLAGNEILVFLDDDVIINEDYINNLENHFNNSIDAICGRINIKDYNIGYIKPHNELLCKINSSIFRLKKCLGGNLIIKKTDFHSVDGFDLSFGIGAKYGGAEDIDIILKLLLMKKNIVYAPDVIVYHPKENQSNYELFSKKMYNYGRGEGAVLAKHISNYKIMLLNYIIILAKPLLNLLIHIFKLDLHQVRIFYNILNGRLVGFFEYLYFNRVNN